MWRSALLSLLALAPLSLAQRDLQWNGWRPGPSWGHDNNDAKVIDLSGNGWTLTSQNGSIKVKASVPSQQYLDLYAAGVIGDPLYGTENTNLGWVQFQNWTYSRDIQELRSGGWSNFAASGTSTYLVFEGLDTFTTISMCGHEVAYTMNQYRQYVFDVTNTLKSCRGRPSLSLNFGPAVNITHQLSKGPLMDGVTNFVDSCTDDPAAEFSCKAYARKEQNDFGWDWSPSLTPAGPWKPIYAVQISRNQMYVTNADFDIYRQGQMNNLPPDQSQPWVFNASIDFEGNLPRGSGLQLTLKDAGGRQVLQKQLGGVYSSSNTITGNTIIDPSSVELWWPNGLGSQTLYNATVNIIGGSDRSRPSRGSVLASAERRVGFRTIVLNLDPVTAEQMAQGTTGGANWHFEINGHEFYAKGANLVPPNAFWPAVTDEYMTNLFMLVKNANMNLLRVWSSGAYLPDWIYDIADEMGILLWSELEFTDATYPINPTYLAEYTAEAYYNVRRLNHHASLALWCGGNELEAIILGLGVAGTPNYEQIQLRTLIAAVYANTRSISYIPSSTYHGFTNLDFNSTMPQTPRYNGGNADELYEDSDVYIFDVPDLFNYYTYPTARFAAEFGYISMPSIYSWETEAPEDQLYIESPTVVNHNRHTLFGSSEDNSLAGIHQITDATHYWLPAPDMSNSKENFTAWCYSMQIVQAQAVMDQIAFFRRGSGMPERQLGSLFWQLNDLWVAPSWASIEYSGRQKIFYYAAKNIYSPVIVYPYYNMSTTDLAVYVTSDLWNPVSGTLSYQWVDWHGNPIPVDGTSTIEGQRNGSHKSNITSHSGTQSKPSTLNWNVGAINTTEVIHYPNLQKTFSNNNLNMTNAVLILSIETSSDSGSATHRQFLSPANLKNVQLPDPGLKLTQNGSGFTVTATKAVAAWVWLEYDTNDVQGLWSDNGFWLNKGESKDVTFTVISGSGDWASTVGVRSLYDNYGS